MSLIFQMPKIGRHGVVVESTESRLVGNEYVLYDMQEVFEYPRLVYPRLPLQVETFSTREFLVFPKGLTTPTPKKDSFEERYGAPLEPDGSKLAGIKSLYVALLPDMFSLAHNVPYYESRVEKVLSVVQRLVHEGVSASTIVNPAAAKLSKVRFPIVDRIDNLVSFDQTVSFFQIMLIKTGYQYINAMGRE